MRRKRTSAEIKQQRKYLAQQNALMPEKLTLYPKEKWLNIGERDPKRFAIWNSKLFFVQAFNEANGIIRLTICRRAMDDNGDWRDGITWDQIQQIKSECGYGDKDAVEIYPADKDIVNQANMRHIWILPDEIPYKWRD